MATPPSGKPRVLVVTSTLPRWSGDTEPAFVLDLCRALATRYEVVALAPHCRGAERLERQPGLEVRRFRYFLERGEVLAYEGGILPKLRRRPWLWLLVPWFFLGLVVAVARTLRRERFALVHAHWLVPQGVAVRFALAIARRPVPLVCTAHGADVFGLRGGLARRLQAWVSRGSARVGAVSAALGRELVDRGAAPAQVRLMPMGVRLPPTPANFAARDSQLVAFAGRIVEKKGVDVLLEAFNRLSERHPAARLCLAGGGPDLARCREQAGALGLGRSVQFLGAVAPAQVEQLFARAAVAVMPSVTARDGDAEGLGLVMLEAMAAGCPVVVTDLPAVRDVIQPGENALVFPERDAAALAAALDRLLADRALAARLAARGRADVERRYGWSAVAANHAAVYEEVIAMERA